MLATKIARPPIGAEWSFEAKFDGLRSFVVIEDGDVTLLSRNGTDMSRWFPELATIAKEVTVRQAILDGEIILRDGSLDSFNALLARARSRGRTKTAEPVTYVAFDVLAVDGAAIIDLPLDERRATLHHVIEEAPPVSISRVFIDGDALYAAALNNGLEGIVGKVRTSKYVEGRSRERLKND